MVNQKLSFRRKSHHSSREQRSMKGRRGLLCCCRDDCLSCYVFPTDAGTGRGGQRILGRTGKTSGISNLTDIPFLWLVKARAINLELDIVNCQGCFV